MAIDWQVFKGKSLVDAVESVLSCEQFRNNKDLEKLINKKYGL